MRRKCAERHLHNPERRDDKEIFHRGTLRRRRIHSQQRVLVLQQVVSNLPFLRTEIPHHAADTAQQQDKADHTPHHRIAGRHIVNEWLVRPVLRVAHIGSRPVRGSSPSRPPEERSELANFFGILERAAWNRVRVTSV